MAITLLGMRTKTGVGRTIPVGERLRAVLTMRRTDPAGEDLPPTAHVFGTPTGGKIASAATAWRLACRRAEFLGHAAITTTSRYLQRGATPAAPDSGDGAAAVTM